MDGNGNNGGTLGAWMEAERIRRGWSQRHIARASGFSATAINKIINGLTDSVSPELCQAIARVFDVSVDEVYARAGILPERGDVLPEVKAWSDRLRRFSPADRQRLTEMIAQLFDLAEPRPRQSQESTGSDL